MAASVFSVERMRAYTTDFEAEKPALIADARPPPEWPSAGQISVQQLVVTYRPDLPPALRNLTLRINGGEKVRPSPCAVHLFQH